MIARRRPAGARATGAGRSFRQNPSCRRRPSFDLKCGETPIPAAITARTNEVADGAPAHEVRLAGGVCVLAGGRGGPRLSPRRPATTRRTNRRRGPAPRRLSSCTPRQPEPGKPAGRGPEARPRRRRAADPGGARPAGNLHLQAGHVSLADGPSRPDGEAVAAARRQVHRDRGPRRRQFRLEGRRQRRPLGGGARRTRTSASGTPRAGSSRPC